MNKLLIYFALLFFLLFSLAACGNGAENVNVSESNIPVPASSLTEQEEIPTQSETPQSSDTKILLTFEGGEAIVSLEDNAATRDLVSKLPLTHTFEDFNSIEKICRLPEEIITEGIESGVDPEVADVTLYIPWNTLVFYYEDFGYHDDLIPIGYVESGMDLLAGMGDEFTVTMEVLDSDLVSSSQSVQEETTEITLTAGDTVITATLDDSETTQEFLATLPRTLSMSRYGDREYYGRISAISENGENISNFENGDVIYYPAGPSFAIFYAGENNSGQSGLIRMGKITSDLSAIDELGESIDVFIEIAKDSQKNDNTAPSLTQATISPAPKITQNEVQDTVPTTSSTPETALQNEGGKILIAYFSRVGNSNFEADVDAVTSASIRTDGSDFVGNCEVAALMAQEETGGDLFFIETVDKYPSAYRDTTDQASVEQANNTRPALSSHVENMAVYDTVILIYPNWWGTSPQPVFTFLEEYDFSGKTILPLCTHEGSAMGSSERDIAALCPDADLLGGLAIRGSRVDDAIYDITEWLNVAGVTES